MFEILPLMIVTTFLAFLSHEFSDYDSTINEYRKKEKLFYIIMVILLIIFAGTRLEYNDTWVYRGGYENTRALTVNNFLSINWLKIGENPGFVFLELLMKYLHFSSQTFIMAFSIMSIAITYKFIWKYSNDLFLSSYFAFVFIYVDFLAAIKQMFAMSLCLVAVDRLIQGKKIRFILWLLIASTIHPYSLMYLICALFFFKPWSRKTAYMLFGFLIIGFSFRALVSRIVFFTTLIGEDYTVENLTLQGMNPLRVAVLCVPIFLSFLLRDRIKYSNDDRENNLFLNTTMLSGELSFVALFGTAILMGRVSNYFLPFQVLSIPWLFKYLDKKYKWVVTTAAIILYFVFFTYDCYRSGNQVFDVEFSRMTLFDYIDEGIFN